MSVDEALAIKRSQEGYGGPLRGTLVRCLSMRFALLVLLLFLECFLRVLSARVLRCRRGTLRPLAVPARVLAPGEQVRNRSELTTA